jgi:hypothetical protein
VLIQFRKLVISILKTVAAGVPALMHRQNHNPVMTFTKSNSSSAQIIPWLSSTILFLL